MPAYKGDNFSDRLSTAANAKKSTLEKFRARPTDADPGVAERQAARQAVVAAREVRMAERKAARELEAARQAEERAARELEAARAAEEQAARDAEQAARNLALEAERKAARDARYAARKARR